MVDLLTGLTNLTNCIHHPSQQLRLLLSGEVPGLIVVIVFIFLVEAKGDRLFL